MNYHVILFDADGMTLQAKRFSEQIEQDYGIPWETMKPFFSGPFGQCKLGKADLKEELEKVIASWGWKGTVDELMAYWFEIGSAPDLEIIEIVNELRAKGVLCFLATNQEQYRADYLREVVGLETVFDGLLVSSELGHTKDEVAYFEEVYDYLTNVYLAPIPKEEILFVDHDEKNLLAAETFGFETYPYTDVESFRNLVLSSRES